MRAAIRRFVESKGFQGFIITVIVINAITIGIQTGDIPEDLLHALIVFDNVCLGIYIVEAILKLTAYGLDYFKDRWNRFDFTIIVLALIPSGILPIPVQIMRIMRLLRIVRVFKLVSVLRQLRIIIEAIGKSMAGVVWTGLLLVLLMYVFDVVGVNLFGAEFPELFGDLGTGLFTLFQLVTLEGWNELASTIMATYPLAWLFFVPYIIFTAFIMMNVVVGIILTTVEDSTQIERINQYDDVDQQLATELAELREQLDTVQYMLDKHARLNAKLYAKAGTEVEEADEE